MTQPRVRALAIDVDGTLLGPDHRVSARNRDAVREAHAAGVRIVLASARYPGAMLQFERLLGLVGEPLVACQGALWGTWTDAGRFDVGGAHTLPYGTSREVVRHGRELGLWASWYTADGWFAEEADPMATAEVEIVGVDVTRVRSWDELSPDRAPAKLCLMAEPGDLHLIAVAQRGLPAGVEGAVSRPDYLEVAGAGISKWAGVVAALASVGVAPSGVAAVGDGENDIEMLQGAAWGVAMGNAAPSVQQIADWIAPPNTADGLAAAIERLLGT